MPLYIALLTGGFDRPYAFGLTMALTTQEIKVDVIGAAELDCPEMRTSPGIHFLNLYGDPRNISSPGRKLWSILSFYVKLFRYAVSAKPPLFHILWNNKLKLFDRTLLMLCYKAVGKKIVFTAHNVNAGKRDANDSVLNRLTLKIQYRLADHIFVHTAKMKQELVDDFGVAEQAVTVIPFGINNSIPNTDLTRAEARQRLGIRPDERTILFFGNVRPYKGLEYLVDAFNQLEPGNYRLIIAGETKRGTERYMSDIQQAIRRAGTGPRILEKLEYISDQETEVYFKAADVCVLPYTLVFQSGVLLLSYSFGLPVIASDVGSISEDVIPEKTGLVCRPRDPADLARAIREYFDSDLYRSLDSRRREIQNYAVERYSWDRVGEITRNVYTNLLSKCHK
jgi:glycosyltransferase involved in cell wall biosynthesis